MAVQVLSNDMINQRPFLRLAIQKIESLFLKNKKNPIVLDDIRNELANRKTGKAKELKIQVIDQLNEVENIDKNEIEQKLLGPLNSDNSKESGFRLNEDSLKSISLVSFVKKYDVSARVRNAILEESNFFDMGTLYDFVYGTDCQKALLRIPKFGKGSLDDLWQSVNHFIANDDVTEWVVEEYLDKHLKEKQVYKALRDCLSSDQSLALKAISLGFFVNNFDGVTVRTENAILWAINKNLCDFDSLYDFYVAPLVIKESLLSLDNFGRSSLANLVESVDSFIQDKDRLNEFANFASDINDNEPCNINSTASIEAMLDYEISILSKNRDKEVVKSRNLLKNILTLEEIGKKIGVTRERVRQIEKTALSKIRKSLFLKYSDEELFEWSKEELNKFFFYENSFISIDTAKSILKSETEPTSIKLLIRIVSGNLEQFLNEFCFYSTDYKGWFLDDHQLIPVGSYPSGITPATSLQEFDKASNLLLSLDEAILKSGWPIKLEAVAEKMSLPEEVTLDKVLLSRNLQVYENDNKIFIRYKKLKSSTAVRLALGCFHEGATFIELQKFIKEAFNLKLSTRAVSSFLYYLSDAVMIERGKYSKYTLFENLNLDEDQTENIKKFTIKYLMKRQEYVSVSIIYNKLQKENNSTKFGFLTSPYILYEICKVDKRFISCRGAMLGLKSDRFQGVFTPLMKEYINLMKKYNRPLTAAEIIKELSTTRSLLEAAVYAQLNNDIHGIFIRTGNGFFLANDKSHLEIDDGKLEEFEFDDL